MSPLKYAFNWLCFWWLSALFRSKKVYTVVGLRRSGNHACINWLANALERQPVSWEEQDGCFSCSVTGRTVLFNEANWFGVAELLRIVWRYRQSWQQASFVIISLEDWLPSACSPYVPRGSVSIAVTRSCLNLIASRIQRAVNQAEQGLDRGDMRVDKHFIRRLKWLHDAEQHQWLHWHYDDWLVNGEYRSRFLQALMLSYDRMPAISSQGGGSSFSHHQGPPDPDQARTRWTQVRWPERIVQLLTAEPACSLLTHEEQAFIREFLD
ncbi:hypothetical protein HMF8227_01172 [Saliniradius amylolyticus]|uniref:Sulfotransferase domain-containing protein n=1 Tax=Saliniradius amylolyticus TaxID=2183582 RepID=A0A2S2E1Y5_9ALTE|nr:hypothetical protein [Saliniradius amylolyticus]AWL11653.1 hypothetical protein HMF8227_01172 [Saliniradius amylolyticus]